MIDEHNLLLYGFSALGLLLLWAVFKFVKKVLFFVLVAVVILSFGLYAYLKLF